MCTVLSIDENLNQAKPFAHQHHVFAELAKPSEIDAVRLAPIGEAAVALAFFVGEGGVDLIVTAIGHFGGFDHAAWVAASIAHDPAFAQRRCIGFVLGRAGRGLDALHHEVEQLVSQLRPIAEGE